MQVLSDMFLVEVFLLICFGWLSIQRVVEFADQLCFPVPLAWMTCGSVDGLVPDPIKHYK